MYIRRYNPLDTGVLQRRLHSYYQNPSGQKRRRIEEMLQSAVEAMKSTEEAISKSNSLVVDLFREFLDYTKEQDEVSPRVRDVIVEVEPDKPSTPPERRSEEPMEKLRAEIIKMIADYGSPLEASRATEGVVPSITLKRFSEGGTLRSKSLAMVKAAVANWKKGSSPADKIKQIKQMVDYYGGYTRTAKKVGDPGIPVQTNVSVLRRVYRTEKLPRGGARGDEANLKLDVMLDSWVEQTKTPIKEVTPSEPPQMESPVSVEIEEPEAVQEPPITDELPNMRAATAKILETTASNPTTTYSFADFRLPVTSRAKAKLKKIPEIDQKLVLKGEIRRADDTIYMCPTKHRYSRIAYATDLKGKQPARRGEPRWDQLLHDRKRDKAARKSLVHTFERICEESDGKIQDGRVYKRLRGDLWEFKSGRAHQIRIPCFMRGDTIFLTNIFKRNISDKVLDKAIDKSEKIMKEHIARPAKRRNPYHSSWQDYYDRIIDLEYEGAEGWLTPEEVDHIAQRAYELARIERQDPDLDEEYIDYELRDFSMPWFATERPPDD